MRSWQGSVEGLLSVAKTIAERLLEVNGLPSGSLASAVNTAKGFTHTLGYTGIYVEWYGGEGYAYVSLLYGELCRRGLFPPKHPVSLSVQLEESSPFGRDRWLLIAIAAYFDRLAEAIADEYERWAVYRGRTESFAEFRYELEESWLEGMSFNLLSHGKLEILKDLAPSTYRHLSLALGATNGAKLWVKGDLDAALLAAVADVTEESEEEIAELVPGLLREASASQRRLQKLYLKEAAEIVEGLPSSRVIRVRGNPCEDKCDKVGPWIIARWY